MIMLSNKNADIPSTMAEAFEELQKHGIIKLSVCTSMQNAVGFRNLIVHAYKKIDWKIVWNIISNNLDDFRLFAQAILND